MALSYPQMISIKKCALQVFTVGLRPAGELSPAQGHVLDPHSEQSQEQPLREGSGGSRLW